MLTVSFSPQAALQDFTFRCGRCKQLHVVHNDPLAAQLHLESLFHQLEALLEHAELRERMEASNGKMLAVLLTRNSRDEAVVLNAFSGDLGGIPDWPGFVPSVLRRERTAELEALTLQRIRSLEVEMQHCTAQRALELKRQRRQLSRSLMSAMHDAATLRNRAGFVAPLREAFDGRGMPSGTADCALPKLLHEANVQGLEPLAWAEAFYAPAGQRGSGSRHLRIEPPCLARCVPIIGFLLCRCA